METMTLTGFLTAVIYEAGIDGQTGANGRHSPANLTELFNRTWSSLLSLAASSGQTQRQDEQTGTVPAAAATEDFSIIPWPTTATDVHGIDVFTTSSFGWQSLDPIQWETRREVKIQPDSPGWWSLKKLPRENGAGAPLAGEVAVFPNTLVGLNYKMFYFPHWVPIASTDLTFLIVGYPDWFQWAINSMVMILTKRDKKTRDTYLSAKVAKDEAEARITANAKKRQRQGKIIPRRRDGLEL